MTVIQALQNFSSESSGSSGSSIQATGGTITTPGNGFKYHTFTSSGTFTITTYSLII